MAEFLVLTVRRPEEMADALTVRRAVFIEEQSVAEEEEIDHHDGNPAAVTTALHVLGRLDGAPVATGRLLLEYPPGGNAHVGRVAVLAAQRGRGFGSAIMAALHGLAREHGFSGIT